MKQLFTKTLLATLMGGVIALSGCSQPTSNDSPGSTTTSPSLLVAKERLAPRGHVRRCCGNLQSVRRVHHQQSLRLRASVRVGQQWRR